MHYGGRKVSVPETTPPCSLKAPICFGSPNAGRLQNGKLRVSCCTRCADKRLGKGLDSIDFAPPPSDRKAAPLAAEALPNQTCGNPGKIPGASDFAYIAESLGVPHRQRRPNCRGDQVLGVRLRDLRRTRPLKKVLITSTIPQEGKSTISANLACALALSSEEKVLLVEGDYAAPCAPRMFGIGVTSGIPECVKDEGRQLTGIYRLEDTGVWILPAGETPINPLELLQSHQLQSVMERLTEYFDWIIIDSPPVLPLADTSIWMRMADGVLLVARQGTTEKRQLQKGLEALDQKKLLGAILNGSVASAYSGYYDRPSVSS